MKKLIVALFLFSIHSLAAAGYYHQGDKVVGIAGGFNYFNVSGQTTSNDSIDGDFKFLTLNGEFGHFVQHNLSVGAETVWLYIPEQSKDNKSSFSALGLNGYARYHFNTAANIIPFAGVHMGLVHLSASDDGNSDSNHSFAYGFHGGVDVPVNSNVFFDTQVRWSRYNLPTNSKVDLDHMQILFGLKIKLNNANRHHGGKFGK